jgi:carbon storage regulator
LLKVLISRRKEGEALLIGDGIELRVVSVHKKKVVLGVIAPRNVKISARKLNEAEKANTMAAVSSLNLDQLCLPSPDAAEKVLFLLKPALGTSDELTDKNH